MKVKNKCLNCKNRYLGCHSKCESYKEYKASLEKMKMSESDRIIQSYEHEKMTQHFKRNLRKRA